MDQTKASNSKLLLSLEEAAELTGIGLGSLRKVASGLRQLPGFPPVLRVGGRRLIRRADLESWVAGLGAVAEEPPRRRGRPRMVAEAARRAAGEGGA